MGAQPQQCRSDRERPISVCLQVVERRSTAWDGASYVGRLTPLLGRSEL